MQLRRWVVTTLVLMQPLIVVTHLPPLEVVGPPSSTLMWCMLLSKLGKRFGIRVPGAAAASQISASGSSSV